MFFQERITKIKQTDKVLEVGPGASPHIRSDVFLELKMEKEEDYAKQFGHNEKLVTQKPVVFYDGKKFPFADKEFDYVICSHVLEHVEDVEFFLSELFRVAKRGYLEYPLFVYDYLFNFQVHPNFIRKTDEALHYMKKEKVPLNEFRLAQDFLLELMQKGYMTRMLTELPEFFFEGFEWEQPFPVKKTEELSFYLIKKSIPQAAPEQDLSSAGAKKLSKELMKSLLSKFRS